LLYKAQRTQLLIRRLGLSSNRLKGDISLYCSLSKFSVVCFQPPRTPGHRGGGTLTPRPILPQAPRVRNFWASFICFCNKCSARSPRNLAALPKWAQKGGGTNGPEHRLDGRSNLVGPQSFACFALFANIFSEHLQTSSNSLCALAAQFRRPPKVGAKFCFGSNPPTPPPSSRSTHCICFSFALGWWCRAPYFCQFAGQMFITQKGGPVVISLLL
jgi:hypothetical protein